MSVIKSFFIKGYCDKTRNTYPRGLLFKILVPSDLIRYYKRVRVLTKISTDVANVCSIFLLNIIDL